MIIRKTEVSDIAQVLAIYDSAREYMRREGNENQWINGYPNKETLLSDMSTGESFVCLNEQGEIVGTFFFHIGDEPTYKQIQGAWKNDNKYGVIHRIASNGKVKHLLIKVLDYCFTQIDTIRIDTHKDNKTMLSGLKNYGFEYCGIIYLPDGSQRLAFELAT